LLIGTVLRCEAAEPLATVPLLDRAPVIDGAIGAAEWGGAAVLQPLTRTSDATIQDFATRVSLAWSPDVMFIAIQQERPPHAPMQDASKSKDRLTITITGPSGKKLKLTAWAGASGLEPKDSAAVPSWQQAGSLSTHGWTTEIQLPLNRLGNRSDFLSSGAELEIELREPSLGAEPRRLAQRLRFVSRQLAFRFLDAGEFEGGSSQGCMVELVNADEQPAQVAIQMSVTPADGESKQFENANLKLPGDSRRRVRLTFPAARGRYQTRYQLAADGALFTGGEFAFDGGGPLQVEVVPFHLWRGGVFIKSRMAIETNSVTYCCRLKKVGTTKSLTMAETTGKGNEIMEQFLQTSQLRPGPYLVTVSATRENSVLAERTITFIRPEYPKWWKQPPSP
jgi:hypothetical protein